MDLLTLYVQLLLVYKCYIQSCRVDRHPLTMSLCNTGASTGSNHNLGSLQFAPGSFPLVSRMAIYNGSKIDEASSPEMPLNCYYGQVYLQKAEVLRTESYTKGLKLHVLAGKNYSKICLNT